MWGCGEKDACLITTGRETPGSPWRRSRPCRHGAHGQPCKTRSVWGVCNFSLTQPLGAASSEVLPVPGQPSSATECKEAAPQLTKDAPVDIPPLEGPTCWAEAVSGLCQRSRILSFLSQASIPSQPLAPQALSQCRPPRGPSWDTSRAGCCGTGLYLI